MSPGDRPGSIITSRAYRMTPARRGAAQQDQVIDLTMPHLALVPLSVEGEPILALRVRGNRLYGVDPYGADPRSIILTPADALALRDALNEWLHPELLTSDNGADSM